MTKIVTIYDGPDACTRCLGWKRIATSADGESWKEWAELPQHAATAVLMGLVRPIVCPRCDGTGQEPGACAVAVAAARALADAARALVAWYFDRDPDADPIDADDLMEPLRERLAAYDQARKEKAT